MTRKYNSKAEIRATLPVAKVAKLIQRLELVRGQLGEYLATDDTTTTVQTDPTFEAIKSSIEELAVQGAALLNEATRRPESDYYVATFELEDESVCIADQFGEVVYWEHQEWIDEPELVATIANAVREAAIAGTKDMRRRTNKQIFGYCPKCGFPVVNHAGYAIEQGQDKLWYHQRCPSPGELSSE